MTSKFIWQIGEDWSITKVSKGNNKLFADAKATPVYAVLGNSQMLETDTVEMTCTINGQSYHKVLLHYAKTSNRIIVDNEAVDGWEVVSNGEELQTETSTFDVMTISFDVKRFSTVDGTTLLKNQPTGQTTENVYASDSYTPMVESSDAEHLEDLIAELNAVKQDKYDTSINTEEHLVVDAINDLITDKQDKYDENLETDSKTVVGAINEVNSKIDSHDEDIDEKLAKKVDKEVKQNDKVTQINNSAGGVQLLHGEGTTFQDLEDDQIRIEHNKITIQSESNVIGSGTIMEITPNGAKINNKKIPEALNVSSQSTQDTYSSNYINEQIDTAIEIAEGKTATYTISDVTNPTFNSNNDTISLSSIDTITDILGNVVSLSDLDVGDIILVTETEVPDRWVGSIASNVVTFYKMETSKIDLSNYATKTELATKQDKLTAGTGITIDSNNVISASGGLTEVTASDVDSEQATQGQVLTADGQGGASWQKASGGDKWYLHKLQINNTTLYANITTKSQTTFTIESLRQYIYDMMGANRPLYCLFKIQQKGNTDYTIYYGLQATSSNLKLSGSNFGYSIDFSAQTFENKSISSPTGNISALTDNVIEL